MERGVVVPRLVVAGALLLCHIVWKKLIKHSLELSLRKPLSTKLCLW